MIKTIHFIFDTLINHTVAIFRQIIPFLRQKGIIFSKFSKNSDTKKALFSHKKSKTVDFGQKQCNGENDC